VVPPAFRKKNHVKQISTKTLFDIERERIKLNPRDIDKLIATKVFGYMIKYDNLVQDGYRTGIPSYSTKIEYAWQVVEKLEYNVKITKHKELEPRYQAHVFVPDNVKTAFGETASMAICKAALEVVGEGIE
jgi:hypothetical protein